MFDIQAARFSNRTVRRTMVTFVENKLSLTSEASYVNDLTDGKLLKALKTQAFEGKKGTSSLVTGLDVQGLEHVIAVGAGKLKAYTREDWVHLGISLGKMLDKLTFKEISILVGTQVGQTTPLLAAQSFMYGLNMAMYRFDQFKSKPKPACPLKKITLFMDGASARQFNEDMDKMLALMEAQCHARTLVNMPPNVANPEYMAQQARELTSLGLEVEVLDEDQLTDLGMNLMMAVGKGSRKEDQPRLILVKYTGAGKDQPYRALVGKGVMFDTGGYNVKPAKSMQTMKADMGGAAAVFGTMKALAQRKPAVNVIGVLGCATNMISAEAFIDDEIYTGYNGKTVEIGHTDAEGRMVLADAVAYTVDKYKPVELIDLATLTGAVLVALAGKYAGLCSETERLANALLKAGEATGEQVWRLPTDEEFLAKSSVADMNNDGSPYGGSSVGALFIKQFVGSTPWAHLDIAGVAMNDKASMPKRFPSLNGATGFGVRLLVEYLEAEAEKLAPAPRKRRSRK